MAAVKRRSARMGYRATDEFRELAVTHALSGQFSIPMLADIYGIGQSTLYRWTAASKRTSNQLGPARPLQQSYDPTELIRRERNAFKIVAIALARELAGQR